MQLLNGVCYGSCFRLSCAVAQTPVLFDGGTVNGITYAAGQPLAPGSIASLFGSQLAASLAQADTVPLSTNLTSVSVTMNGISAPLFFVSPGQINVQVPWNVLPDGVDTGMATVVVSRGQSVFQWGVRADRSAVASHLHRRVRRHWQCHRRESGRNHCRSRRFDPRTGLPSGECGRCPGNPRDRTRRRHPYSCQWRQFRAISFATR